MAISSRVTQCILVDLLYGCAKKLSCTSGAMTVSLGYT